MPCTCICDQKIRFSFFSETAPKTQVSFAWMDLVLFFSIFAVPAYIPALLRLFVPGNHDLSFDIYPIADVQKQIPSNVKLLLNNGFSFSGLNFYSIEARPWLHTPLSIPDSLDILVTHGAAKGYLDNGHGCSLLAEAISKHPPKVHLFGHTHECGNLYLKTDYTTYYNVSLYQDLFQQQ